MKIVNVEQMHHIEQAADAGGHSYAAMMDMAGRSVAETAHQLILGEPDQNVLVLVGPGNNGGDGLVAARYLLEAGQNVTVYVWKRKTKSDANFGRLKRRRRGVSILWADNDTDWAPPVDAKTTYVDLSGNTISAPTRLTPSPIYIKP